MMSPPFIGAYSWILLLGSNGLITQWLRSWTGLAVPSIYGFAGILIVLTLQLVPLIFTYLWVLGAPSMCRFWKRLKPWAALA
jgi:iron(III) transport system permease protein